MDDKQLAAALPAFQNMVHHKLCMWDAANDLEEQLGCDVDTGKLDHIACQLDAAWHASRLTIADLREYLEDLCPLRR